MQHDPAKRCIINVACGFWYPGAQRFLVASLDALGDKTARLFYTDYASVGAPDHGIDHYAFKPYAFQHAIDKGFTSILWIDSAIRVLQPLAPVWADLERDGYYLVDNEMPFGEWSSDAAIEAFGISRQEALTMPEIRGSTYGVDVTNPLGAEFLRRLRDCADRGLFRGDWFNDRKQVARRPKVKGHRHDQTCATLIAHQLGMMNWHKGVSRYHNVMPNPGPEVIFFNKGNMP